MHGHDSCCEKPNCEESCEKSCHTGCCSHEHEEDAEMAQLQAEFNQYAQSHLPDGFAELSEEAKSEAINSLLEQFQEEKSAALEAEGRLEASLQYIHANMVTPEKFAVQFDPQNWLDNVPQKQRRYIKYQEDVDITEWQEGVFGTLFLEPKFASQLGEWFEFTSAWLQEHKITLPGPNSMNKYGCDVQYLGLKPCVDVFMQLVLVPFFALKFPSSKVRDSNGTYRGFFVHYKAATTSDSNSTNKNTSGLDTHVDDSDMTLNMCLSSGFTGGELQTMGDAKKDQELPTLTIPQELGVGLVHAGSVRHKANPITSNTRVNLVIWYDVQDKSIKQHC